MAGVGVLAWAAWGCRCAERGHASAVCVGKPAWGAWGCHRGRHEGAIGCLRGGRGDANGVNVGMPAWDAWGFHWYGRGDVGVASVGMSA